MSLEVVLQSSTPPDLTSWRHVSQNGALPLVLALELAALPVLARFVARVLGFVSLTALLVWVGLPGYLGWAHSNVMCAGTNEQVLTWLKTQNVHKVALSQIAWRMSDKKLYSDVSSIC